MVHRLRKNGETFYDGDLVKFVYKDVENTGLLFFNEAERRFMLLLSSDSIILVEEIKENSLKNL